MHESMPHISTPNYINELRNQLEFVTTSKRTIERSEIIDKQMWLHSPECSVAYLDVEGNSPPITNHLSAVTYKINWGEGRLLTESSETQLQPGTEVTIFRGHEYKYRGQFDAVVEAKPGLNSRFVTFYGDKLGRKEAKELKHLQNGHTRYMRAIAKILNMALEAVDITNPNSQKGYL